MRPSFVKVSLPNVAHNLGRLRELCKGGAQVIPVLKADAYGHGLVPVARACISAGISALAVAIVEEGFALRDAGVQAKVIVLGSTPAGEVKEAVARGLTLTLPDASLLPALALAARELGKPAEVQLKVDTGMSRLGSYPEELLPLLSECGATPGLEVSGLWSHLATAEEPDTDFAIRQLEVFTNCVRVFRNAAFNGSVHVCNSAGMLKFPDHHYDAVRPGLLVYGVLPDSNQPEVWGFRPALSLHSTIGFAKLCRKGATLSYGRTHVLDQDTLIGTVPVGYGDGYPRSLSNRAQALVRGERVPVLGRVCMDQMLVDLSGVPGAAVGDEVVLIGTQGSDRIDAVELADWADTTVHEILCRLGPRLPRVYAEDGPRTHDS